MSANFSDLAPTNTVFFHKKLSSNLPIVSKAPLEVLARRDFLVPVVEFCVNHLICLICVQSDLELSTGVNERADFVVETTTKNGSYSGTHLGAWNEVLAS